MIGPVRMNTDLRDLPHMPPGPKISRPLLKPGLHGTETRTESEETSSFPNLQSLLGKIFRPVPNMPPPLFTFDGVNSVEGQCGCIPPDTNGDVGPNHYVETTNVAVKVFDKSGNTLLAAVPFDTFFAPLGGTTPCGTGLNQGDPFSFYDPLADRWVVSDFAFASFGGNPSYECIGVSQTSDPVSGGWFLYAVLVDPTDANDYPKAAIWSEPAAGRRISLHVQHVGQFTGALRRGESSGARSRGNARWPTKPHRRHLYDPPGWFNTGRRL